MILTKLQIAEEIAKFRRMYTALLSVEEDFFKVGTLEQASSEAQTTLDTINKQLREAREAAANESFDVLANAKTEAAQIIENANFQSLNIISDGRTKLEAQLGLLAQKKAGMLSDISALTDRIQEMQKDYESLSAQNAALKADCAALTAQKQDAEQALQTLLAKFQP